MIYKKAAALVKRGWIFYLLGFTLIIGIKYFYSKAGANELKWILTPTAWWVRHLSGIPFEFEPDVGYINYNLRFIIASSCSGVQFMIISIATLVFSFIHRMNTIKKGMAWMAFSLGISYLFTILVNGLRIVASIYLPLYVGRPEAPGSLIGPERLHTLIGIAIYFTSLFTLYQTAGWFSRKLSLMGDICERGSRDGSPSPGQLLWKCAPPVFWYFAIVLGIPFLNKAYEHEGRKFLEYAVLMTMVCLAIIALYCLGKFVQKQFKRRKA